MERSSVFEHPRTCFTIADLPSRELVLLLTISDNGSPIRIKDIGEVVFGPDLRRGVSDLDGSGEAVSGIVVMRQGQNALDVIERVKQKLAEIKPGLPLGVSVIPVYDRSELILRAIANLKSTLIEVIGTVAVVILLFLWHVPSSIVPIITIPVAVFLAFIPIQAMGLSANIMSLGGIAIAVSFLPILTLEAEKGRLFKPLAYTKTLCMFVAAFLAITLDPALRLSLSRR